MHPPLEDRGDEDDHRHLGDLGWLDTHAGHAEPAP
jgi:hypothetical protein